MMMNTNPPDPFGHFSPKKQPSSQRVTNFLEAFKENAASRPHKQPRSDVVPSFGDLRPGMPLSVESAISYDEAQKREERVQQQERMFAKQQREAEQARFDAKQEEVEQQIDALREAILKISKSAQNVSHEIEKAAFETPVAPGAYHLSFFEKLKSALEFIKKRLDDSASWLHTMNERDKKAPYFWKQVQKSGTKYMLSSERYMQISSG